MDEAWEEQGEIYKFLLVTTLSVSGGEILEFFGEADEEYIINEETTETTEATSGETNATRLGKKMHKAYKEGGADDVNTFKEFTLPSKKNDFLDLKEKIIYEFRPNNPRAIRLGGKQLEMYKKEVEEIFGEGFKTQLDTY